MDVGRVKVTCACVCNCRCVFLCMLAGVCVCVACVTEWLGGWGGCVAFVCRRKQVIPSQVYTRG